MASLVLGIGTSHTPMLNAPPTDWPRFIERDTQRTNLLDTDGKLTSYEAQLKRAPAGIAARDRARADAGAARRGRGGDVAARRFLREARLDALIVVGDDQDELFHPANMPGILVYYGETIRNVPLAPVARAHLGLAGERALARGKGAARLSGRRAARAPPDRRADRRASSTSPPSDAVPEGEGEGHAIGFVHRRIMQEVVPIVPVCINTYYPPNQPTPRRCYRLGQAIRAAVESLSGRCAGRHHRLGRPHRISSSTRRSTAALSTCLRKKDAAAIQNLPREKLNSGSSEIRNWICVAGAVEHLALEWSHYEPGYRTPAGTGTGLGFALLVIDGAPGRTGWTCARRTATIWSASAPARDGRADAAILAAGGDVVGAEGRRRADAADAAGRAADRVPRQRGPGRRHGPSLPAPLRLAVPRPQRGERHPLRLSRLEIRHRGQLRRHAERAGRARLQEPGPGQGLQGGRAQRPRLGLYGRRARGAAAAGRSKRRCCPKPRCTIKFVQRECNWLQALEGDIDTSHFGFLHAGGVDARRCRRRTACSATRSTNRAPDYHVADTECGTMYAAYRDGGDRPDLLALRQFHAAVLDPDAAGQVHRAPAQPRLGPDGRHPHDVRQPDLAAASAVDRPATSTAR